ncbi:MAG TPA: nicotinate-nucleotide--dimethylbenzimidazole phosphoribosyltransferase [Candidatus Binataceae bacterium]|nr:nicotinate-nucleotide--dimethylbenzimidazole phosphoribosyltransferase [Candidatus Binataceae bacterium]
MDLIEETLAAIGPLDRAAESGARQRLDSLTKPQGSLGRLEEIVARYAAIRGDATARMGRGAILVFVGDHGVAEAGVSAYPKAVTVEMLRNIGAGGAAISVLARRFGYELIVTDVGVETDTSAEPFAGVRYRRVAAGTQNFLRGSAMTLVEARGAIAIGIDTSREMVEAGATLIGIGEMGIANSTAAAALLARIMGIDAAKLVGRGTGVDDAGLRRKIEAVEAALAIHREIADDGISILAAIGGLEIAAMAGACLGAAARKVPIVVDGFIATAAAAVAIRISPQVRDYMFFSHRSAEGGHALALEALGGRPLLDLGMRLGEGTGAALAMNLIESAIALFQQMATFASAGVSQKIE